MDATNEAVLAAQEVLHKAVVKSLEKYGMEVTLIAMAEQFGIAGATAVVAQVVPPSHFTGVFVLRAIGVCNQLCKDNYVEGVL